MEAPSKLCARSGQLPSASYWHAVCSDITWATIPYRRKRDQWSNVLSREWDSAAALRRPFSSQQSAIQDELSLFSF
jgi:hypothetical protein